MALFQRSSPGGDTSRTSDKHGVWSNSVGMRHRGQSLPSTIDLFHLSMNSRPVAVKVKQSHTVATILQHSVSVPMATPRATLLSIPTDWWRWWWCHTVSHNCV